ncbi:MAG: thioesterase domain-containing protein, partial [Burkholderiales bacterium]
EGPYHLCGFSSAGVVIYEMAQQLRAQRERVGVLIMVDTFEPSHHRLRSNIRLLENIWRQKNMRELQERLYHFVLHRMRLGSLRKLHKPGESHRWALWSYVPKPYPGPVVLIATEDSVRQTNDTSLGWSGLARGGLCTDVLPGSHGFLVKEPYVERLAERVQHYLGGDIATPSAHTTPASSSLRDSGDSVHFLTR